jgi:UDP-GlcNAc3NAcA epimerase
MGSQVPPHPIKLVTIIGARPQFIKASVISRLFRLYGEEVLIHTGQHYDDNLSEVFFDELSIPKPDYNLGVGSASHAVQTGEMLAKIESILIKENPDWVLVYGDTNSTLAGALAAVKLHINVAHVEAGLRSYNRRMPEEINRVLTDHISRALFCPSAEAKENLLKEGVTENVVVVGDVMMESLNYAAEKSGNYSRMIESLGVKTGDYYLATIHRAENTDDPTRLENILDAFAGLDLPVVFPIHPRTRQAIHEHHIDAKIAQPNMRVISPVGYLDMVHLENNAQMIITDSGGIQKEAYWLKVPCITLRQETEWIETVESGWNVLAGGTTNEIIHAILNYKAPGKHPALYGDGQAGRKIVDYLLNFSDK